MICLCVTSLNLSLRRLEVGLSIYSRNVVDPRVKLVGVVSPLDKIFGALSSTSCLYNPFYDVRIGSSMLDGLYLLLVKFSFHNFSCQVFKYIRRRIRRI